MLILDKDHCLLYETWKTSRNPDGAWHAGSGAVFKLNQNLLRPAGWTSADAAGLPILPGLVRYGEVAAGTVKHAIRFTVHGTHGYVWPARHLTHSGDSSLPPMGLRFRLKSNFDISGYAAPLQAILKAMKTYGLIIVDNGSDWYASGVPDPRWDNDLLHQLGSVVGDDFEVVDSAGLMAGPDSGVVRQP